MKVSIIEVRDGAKPFTFLDVAESEDVAMGIVDALQQNLVGWSWINGIKAWEKRLAPYTYQIHEREVRT